MEKLNADKAEVEGRMQMERERPLKVRKFAAVRRRALLSMRWPTRMNRVFVMVRKFHQRGGFALQSASRTR